MILDSAIPTIGPIVVACNLTAMLLCLRPKRSISFILVIYAICFLAVHALTIAVGIIGMPLVRYCGLLFLPVNLWLFKGQVFHKVFAFFMLYQVTALPTHLLDALFGITMGYTDPNALTFYIVASLTILAIYMYFVFRFGRRIFERMFMDGRPLAWALYSFGAFFSFLFVLSIDWRDVGAPLYFVLMLFLLWSIAVLCFTIINTHEKAAQTQNAETLALQMSAMREQTNAEKKYREDMEILRHDMRHEMGVIMELYHTGKIDEGKAIFADWENTLAETVPVLLCAEPMLNAVLTRFERKAKDMKIHLHVNSDIPDKLPVDTIKLSVMVSNALENALVSTDKVPDESERIIRVKLLKNGEQIGLEVTNPCTVPVEFDEKGLPVTKEIGHGIGVRSIAAFARDNDYILAFNNSDGNFTLRLVMG